MNVTPSIIIHVVYDVVVDVIGPDSVGIILVLDYGNYENDVIWFAKW